MSGRKANNSCIATAWPNYKIKNHEKGHYLMQELNAGYTE
jgi:hypothetical protein